MIAKELRLSLLLVWPLLLGLLMIMVGNGLQGTLLGMRATTEGFSTATTGLIMSSYYLGFFAGCYITPFFISSVGHIRVFAAFASIASTVILMHGAIIEPLYWLIFRFISGISFAGLFIVAESWLNKMSPNRLRGQIFGSYIFVINAGLFGGQYLLLFGSIEDITHFIIISVFVSLALLPVTLANNPAPGYEEPELIPIKTLLKNSPLALICVFTTGFCSGTIFSLGSVYGIMSDMSVFEIASLIGSFIMGCALIPLLVGWLSDQYDRRRILVGLSFLSYVSAMAITFGAPLTYCIFLFGGLISSVYGIGIAYMNDNIKEEQMVSASSVMILANGAGAALGPMISGYAMGFAPEGIFYSCAMAALICTAYGMYRDYVGDEVIVEDQKDYVFVPTRSANTPFQIVEEENQRP